MTLYPFIRSLKTGLSVARVYPPLPSLQIEGGQLAARYPWLEEEIAEGIRIPIGRGCGSHRS